MMGQTLVAKILNFANQVVLGWFLVPEDFGRVVSALTVGVIATICQETGMREILIRRYRRIHLWSPPAFWVAGLFGIVSAVSIALLAGPAERWFRSPGLAPLVYLVAATALVHGFSVVPHASLLAALRFRAMAWVTFWQTVVTVAFSIFLASRGWGAYSVILPYPIVAIGRGIALYALTRPRVTWRLQLRRWRFVAVDSLQAFIGFACITLVSFADYFLIGRYFDGATQGRYYFAFNLSMQTIMVLGLNLQAVLFPTLSRMQDERARQVGGFLRACGMLAVLGAPACLLQAPAAEPLLRGVWQDRWIGAAGILAVLSLGMTFRLFHLPTVGLILAQGRFTAFMLLQILGLASFVTLVWASAAFGQGLMTVVWTVAGYFLLEAVVTLAVALRGVAGKWREIARMLFPPLVAGGMATGGAWYASRMVHISGWPGPWVQLLVCGGVGLGLYVAIGAVIMPERLRDLLGEARRLLRRGSSDGESR